MILWPNVADRYLLNEALEAMKGRVEESPAVFDYSNCVVLKPWGYEFEIFDDGKHSMWMLSIAPGCSTSMHCHQHKMARFVPIIGEATLLTLSAQFTLRELDRAEAVSGTFHSVRNDSDNQLFLVEIENPPIKSDLVRAADRYGRVGKPYERDVTKDNLEKYEYFRLGEDNKATFRGVTIEVTEGGFIIERAGNG